MTDFFPLLQLTSHNISLTRHRTHPPHDSITSVDDPGHPGSPVTPNHTHHPALSSRDSFNSIGVAVQSYNLSLNLSPVFPFDCAASISLNPGLTPNLFQPFNMQRRLL